MNRLSKIINVGNSYFVEGGDTRYMFFLESLLKSQNVEVIPFAPRHPKNLQSEYSAYFPKSIDIKAASFREFSTFLYNEDANKMLKKLIKNTANIQLAHLHIYYGRLTSSILQPFVDAGIPIIQTLHEYKLACPVYSMISNGSVCDACKGKDFWKCAVKKCNRGSYLRSFASMLEAYNSKRLGNVDSISHFIAASHFLRSKMIEIGIPSEKLTTIHNFIDVTKFNQDFSKGDYFIYIGRVERLKGIFTLLKAFSLLPSCKLIIVGTGEADIEARKFIEDNKLFNVEMVGFKQNEELFQLIEGSIASIIPSEWYENCPISALESYAIGKPIIGSHIGGIPELINHGEDGYLFEPGNIEELASFIERMNKGKQDSVEMGKVGYEKIKREFSPKLHFEKLKAVYIKYLN